MVLTSVAATSFVILLLFSLPSRTIVFAIVGRPVCLLGLRHVLPPQPTALVHGCSREPTDARRRRYRASRSCSWPFSMRVAEEDTVAAATLRLSWR
jgi:predicted exporter